MHTILHDLRFTLRTYARRRAVAALALVTIALGIGAATSIYSVVDGVLLRPLPFQHPERLVAVWQTYPQWRKDPILSYMWDRIPFSLPEFRDWQAAHPAFDGVALWGATGAMFGGPGVAPDPVSIMRSSASMLDVLGVRPVLGRFYLPGEDVVGGSPVVVLGFDTWQTRFGGDPRVLGRAVQLDERPYTIIGVLPRGLSLSRDGIAPAFWIPLGQDSIMSQRRNDRSFNGLGRLKPRVTLEQATAELDHLLRGSEPPDRRGVRLMAWQADQTRQVRQPLYLLLAAAGLLLLIACVNVATLLLGEATGREPEIAARVALGAGRGRIARQLLTEALLLSATGAILGAGLAWVGIRVLVALAPGRIPGLGDVRLDVRVLAFTMAASVVTGLLFGLAPALALARSSPAGALRAAAGQSSRGRGALQRWAVAAELALSVVLLVGAGLLGRSLRNLTAVDPGFRADGLLNVRVTLPAARYRYDDTAAVAGFHRAALERLAAIPGVRAVTLSSTPPFSGGSSSSSVEIEGKPVPAGQRGPEAQQRTTLPNFFQTLGIPVLVGRVYGDGDRAGAPPVVVISEAMARRDWPTESPLGKRVKYQNQWREVIGVVGDTKYRRLSLADQPTIYAPVAQRGPSPNLVFLLRTAGDPARVSAAARAAVKAVEPEAVASADRTTDLIRRSFAEERYRTTLISLFGLIAALLTAVGLYGVTARAVSRRTRELGIRLALGARRASVIRLVVGYTLAGVVVGAAAGTLIAWGASRALAPFLFGIAAADPVTYLGVLLLLAAVSVLASWVPARRATRVSPAVVLRGE